ELRRRLELQHDFVAVRVRTLELRDELLDDSFNTVGAEHLDLGGASRCSQDNTDREGKCACEPLHRSPQCVLTKFSTARLNASGCSQYVECPASGTITVSACFMCIANIFNTG